MITVATNKACRAIDRYLMTEQEIPGCILMDTAARGVADAVVNSPRKGKTAVLIGGGNNGGDGLALMRILKLKGLESIGILCCDPERLKGDALLNYRIAANMHLPMTENLSELCNADIIVDGLFGTGLDRRIEGRAYDAIELANSCSAYRIAIDIPSGMSGDTGEIFGTVFKADETVTVQCIKRGLIVTKNRECVGRITVCPIGCIPEDVMAQFSKEKLIDNEFVKACLPDRRIVSNKGNFGRTLIIAGSPGMSGAALMASTAALRVGSGLVNAVVPDSIVQAFCVRPEIMVNADSNSDIDSYISKASAVGIGCGSGNDIKIKNKLYEALMSRKPCVIDADAINIMGPELISLLHENCVLTPHPGEMSRLIHTDIKAVIEHPVETAMSFSEKHGAVLLLKSAASVIAAPDGRIRYNISGNPGLAKGGSGDVLTGIISGLLAQGLNAFDAASCGAYLLGQSADTALALLKNRALIAGDVIDSIAETIKISEVVK